MLNAKRQHWRVTTNHLTVTAPATGGMSVFSYVFKLRRHGRLQKVFRKFQRWLRNGWMSTGKNQGLRTRMKMSDYRNTAPFTAPLHTHPTPPPTTLPSPGTLSTGVVSGGDDSCLTTPSGGVGLETGWG